MDGQADDQQGDTRENLKPAFLGFERDVPRSGQEEHQRERVQGSPLPAQIPGEIGAS